MVVISSKNITEIINIISQGLVLVNYNGVIESFNKEAGNILNRDCHTVVGQKFWDYFPDNLFGFSMQKAIEQKKIPNDYTHENLNIRTVVLEDAIAIVFEKNLAPLDVAFNDMTSFIAHDIKNPLGAIMGFAKLLKKDVQDNTDLLKFVDFIIQGADNINQFLDLLRSLYKPLNLQLQKVDLNKILQEIKPPESKIEVLSDQTKPLLIEIDGTLLKLSLTNLIAYFQKFLAKKNEFKITLDKDKKNVYIKITFEGKEKLECDFAKKYKSFYPKKGVMELAQIYRIISCHHGSIETNCEGANIIDFTITLREKNGENL